MPYNKLLAGCCDTMAISRVEEHNTDAAGEHDGPRRHSERARGFDSYAHTLHAGEQRHGWVYVQK